MAVVRWLRPPPYKRLSLANKRAFSIIAEIPIAELEMKRRISVREREDCTLVAWYGYLCAPRAGGAYDSHHRTARIAGRIWRCGCRVAARGTRAAAGDAGRRFSQQHIARRVGASRGRVPPRPKGRRLRRGSQASEIVSAYSIGTCCRPTNRCLASARSSDLRILPVSVIGKALAAPAGDHLVDVDGGAGRALEQCRVGTLSRLATPCRFLWLLSLAA